MVRKLGLGLLMVVGLYAQQGNTLYQTLFTGATTFPQTSGNVTNIGQSTHLVYLFASNAPATTCTNALISASLQFSFDQVNYSPFGNPSNSPTPNGINTIVLSGTGAFPYVRVVVGSFDFVHCTLSAYYVGTVQTSVLNSQGSAAIGTQMITGDSTAWSVSPTVIAGINGTGGITNNYIAPILACTSHAFATITAGTSARVVDSAISSTTYRNQIYICNMIATASATGTFTLSTADHAVNCASGRTALTPAVNVNASHTYAVGDGLGVVIKGPISGYTSTITDICGTAVTADMTVELTYAVLNVSNAGGTINLMPNAQ